MSATQPHKRGIISACSWTVDRIKIIDEWPPEEHLAQIVATDQQGGGCGYNLGVDIRKLDDSIPVEAIGLTGDDADGRFLIDNITAAGIDTRQFKQSSNAQTSFTDVFTVADTGKRTFFHHPGSNDHISPDHFDLTQCHGKILHLGLLGVHACMDNPWKNDANGWVTVLKKAQSEQIHTNLELVSVARNRIREIAAPCLPYLSSLITNEYELGALADTDICGEGNTIDESLFIEAARHLFELSTSQGGQLSLIVAHCPTVAFAMTEDGSLHKRLSFTIHPDQIVSAVGAGDAFAAGMLYGLHEHWPLDDSLELAHATAAASLRSATTIGAVESVEKNLVFARGASHLS